VIEKIPLLLFQPIWMYLTLLLIWFGWALSVAFLTSAGELKYLPDGMVEMDKKQLWWAYLIQGLF